MEDSVWKIIFSTLKRAGFDVYPPATKNGICSKEYIVVKKAGSAPILGISSQRDYYMFLLYVPIEKYSYLDEFERKVKDVLDTDLFPMLMPTGSEENDYYDDNFNAHLRSFMYINKVRNKHL